MTQRDVSYSLLLTEQEVRELVAALEGHAEDNGWVGILLQAESDPSSLTTEQRVPAELYWKLRRLTER